MKSDISETQRAQIARLSAEVDARFGEGTAERELTTARAGKTDGSFTLKDQIAALEAKLAEPAEEKETPAPAPEPPKAAEPSKGRALWDHYKGLQGRSQAEFFAANEAAIEAAAREIEAEERTEQRAKSAPAPADLKAAQELWDKYNALQGAERMAFLGEHEADLTTAAHLISAE